MQMITDSKLVLLHKQIKNPQQIMNLIIYSCVLYKVYIDGKPTCYCNNNKNWFKVPGL